MQITIHKLIWQLHAPTQEAAIRGQKVAAELSANATFLNALESRLAALGVDKEHVLIPKLEIDLGRISKTLFAKSVREAVLREVEKEAATTLLSNSGAGVRRTPEERKTGKDVAAFFFSGIQPSGWPKALRTHAEIATWLAKEMASQPTLAASLKNEFFVSKALLDALVNIPTETYLRAIASQFNVNDETLKSALQLLRFAEVSAQAEIKTQLTHILWRFMLEVDRGKAKSILGEAFEIVRKVSTSLPEKARQEANKWIEANKSFQLKALEFEIPVTHAEKPALDQYLASGYFIHNAGLVLIAPFLPVLFETTGVATKKDLKNPGKALAFLAALDLGTRGTQSADQTLYKLLCGLPLEEALPPKVKLTKRDKTSAEELLKEAIGHWKALKNTSPDGLRTGFFWREGIITKKDNGWLLKVETRAQDILLGSLPWGIGVIKLPWMDEPLHVDWA